MMERIVESISAFFPPSSFVDWFLIGCLGILVFIIYVAIYSLISKMNSKRKYVGLLKKYYRQYGNYVFEMDELVYEIISICKEVVSGVFLVEKTPQEIRLDLKNVGKQSERKKTTVKSGIWLMITDTCIKIHPANREAKIYHIKIEKNTVSLSERVTNRQFDLSLKGSSKYKRWLYRFDLSRDNATDSVDNTIWKHCIRYNVSDNTILKVLVEAIGACYDISSCFLADIVAKNACNKYTNQINSLLQAYNIRTEMAPKSWRFYYDDVPITFEEVIKKIPDDVLCKRLDPPTKAPAEIPTPLQSQPKASTPGAAQNTPTIPREPILVFAPYAVDYIITQFIDSDFCFDEVLGVADEARKDLTKYTAIGSWVDAKDPIMRFMEVCNNDITFYKVLESPAAMISFKITEREKYQKVHFSMIVIVNEETSKRIMSQSVPVHQLDDADYKRLEQSLLLRRQDIEDKYNLGNFQDYVERVKIAIPLKTAPEAPTPPQSQPNPSTPGAAQQAPTPPPKAPSKPNLSIEEELLNYLKAQPICWEFPLTTQDKALNQFCEALVFSENVAGISSNEAIKNLELTIQKKRARNPRLADHNAAMEGNILAMLYEYSYLMHIFHALDDMKFDTTKVDIQKLWLLIQQDCNARINHLDEEKRKNPTIQIVLDKYNYDHQITRLKVLNDATGREMDYIISFIMVYSLLTVISLLLGNPKLLQPLKPYPADDIAGMMNALVNTSAGLRFTAYSR